MKKMIMPLLALVLPLAFADNTIIQGSKKPGLSVMVVDTSNSVVRAVLDNKYSLSNKNHQLCVEDQI